MRNYRLPLYLLFVMLVMLQWPAQRVVAHANYDHSDPPADALLPTAPTVVRIWFTEDLFRRAGANGIDVYDAAGTRVDLDDATIDDDDRALMTVSLAPALAAGLYTVRWKTLSADDGHEGNGEFNFTVGDSAGENAPINGDGAATATVATPPPSVEEATLTPALPTATIAPAFTVAGLPCLGGAAPFMFLVGLISVRQRRKGAQARTP